MITSSSLACLQVIKTVFLSLIPQNGAYKHQKSLKIPYFAYSIKFVAYSIKKSPKPRISPYSIKFVAYAIKSPGHPPTPRGGM